MNICEYCGNEFEVSKDIRSTRFCCENHRRRWISKKAGHHKNHKCNFKCEPSPYGTWICRKCNLVFRTRRERQEHKKLVHPNDKAWNQGLTSETSDIIRKSTEKLKEGYRTGRLKAKPLSKESREKLSRSTSAYLESTNYASHGYVKWYLCKNILNQEYKCQGSWEYNVALKLNELGIIWERGKPIEYIQNGIRKIYTPDFYLPKENAYIEVKGKYSPENRTKMKLVAENNPNMLLYFIDVWHYNDFVSGKIPLDKNILKLWW